LAIQDRSVREPAIRGILFGGVRSLASKQHSCADPAIRTQSLRRLAVGCAVEVRPGRYHGCSSAWRRRLRHHFLSNAQPPSGRWTDGLGGSRSYPRQRHRISSRQQTRSHRMQQADRRFRPSGVRPAPAVKAVQRPAK
jgi:hypothetical protein